MNTSPSLSPCSCADAHRGSGDRRLTAVAGRVMLPSCCGHRSSCSRWDSFRGWIVCSHTCSRRRAVPRSSLFRGGCSSVVVARHHLTLFFERWPLRWMAAHACVRAVLSQGWMLTGCSRTSASQVHEQCQPSTPSCMHARKGRNAHAHARTRRARPSHTHTHARRRRTTRRCRASDPGRVHLFLVLVGAVGGADRA